MKKITKSRSIPILFEFYSIMALIRFCNAVGGGREPVAYTSIGTGLCIWEGEIGIVYTIKSLFKHKPPPGSYISMI